MDQFENSDLQITPDAIVQQARRFGEQTLRVTIVPAEDPAIVRARDGVNEATLGSRAMRNDLFGGTGRHSFDTNTVVYRD